MTTEDATVKQTPERVVLQEGYRKILEKNKTKHECFIIKVAKHLFVKFEHQIGIKKGNFLPLNIYFV